MRRKISPRSLRSGALIFLFCLALAVSAHAQALVPKERLLSAIRLLDNAFASKPSLPCYIDMERYPHLDFAFRFVHHFAIDCHLGVIQPGDPLIALVKVIPEGRAPVILMSEMTVPKVPPEQLTRFYSTFLNRVRISANGGFAVGPGSYTVEVALVDGKNHSCRKRSRLRVGHHNQYKRVPVAIPPLGVEPLLDARWNGKLTDNGLRLTILVHADSPSGSARVEDAITILQSLNGLLDQVPCRSVKLIAFSLDRQEEVYRQERFDSDGFFKLQEALGKVEFSTLPWQNLERGAWWKFYAQLIQTEAFAREPADAVVVLGPYGSHRMDAHPPVTYDLTPPHPPFFYFRLGDWEHNPDGLDGLIAGLGGHDFDIVLPEDLATAARKMLAKMRSAQKEHPEASTPTNPEHSN